MNNLELTQLSNNVKEAFSRVDVGKGLGIRRKRNYFSKSEDLLCAVSYNLDDTRIGTLIADKSGKVEFTINYPSLKYSERANEDEYYCIKKERETKRRAKEQKVCLWCKSNFQEKGDKAPVLHHENMNKMIKSMNKLKTCFANDLLQGRVSLTYALEKMDYADIAILNTYKMLIDCLLICNECHRNYHFNQQKNYFLSN